MVVAWMREELSASLATTGVRTATDAAVSLLVSRAVPRSFVEAFQLFVSLYLNILYSIFYVPAEPVSKSCLDSLGNTRQEGEKWEDKADM